MRVSLDRCDREVTAAPLLERPDTRDRIIRRNKWHRYVSFRGFEGGGVFGNEGRNIAGAYDC